MMPNQPHDPTPHLPALLPPTTTLLHRTQTTLGLLREVVQESSAEYWYERGIKYSKEEEWEDAIDAFERSIAINNSDAKVHLKIGWCKTWLGDYTGALADYDRAIELAPSYWAFHDRASAKEVLGDFSGAQIDRQSAYSLNRLQTNLFST